MAGIGKFKLSDALPKDPKTGGKKHSNAGTSHETVAEQAREAKESQEARKAEASNRDRMVDIGRGNQQAGRQGS